MAEVSVADVEESLAPSQPPPADGAQALEPPQHPANAAQALAPPVNGQPTEAALLAAVPKPAPKKRNLRRGIPLEPESLPGAPAIQPPVVQTYVNGIVIGNVPATPVPGTPRNSEQPEKKQPKNRKAKIDDMLKETDDDDDKENGGANMSIIANAGLLAGSK